MSELLHLPQSIQGMVHEFTLARTETRHIGCGRSRPCRIQLDKERHLGAEEVTSDRGSFGQHLRD